MKKRITGLDSARGLTVLLMPAVHTTMLYSQPAVRHSWLGLPLAFFAEGPGAQLFMFILGFSAVLARPKTFKQVCQRGVLLFSAGYLLNLGRMVVPAMMRILPESLLADYVVYPGHPPALSLLLTGDILQMAGLSYVFVQGIARSARPLPYSAAAYTAVIFLAPFLWGIRPPNVLLDHLTGLAASGDYRAFFPLFPWLCYPLAGLMAGTWYIKREDMGDGYILKMAAASAVLLSGIGIALSFMTPSVWDRDFYRAGPGRSLYQTAFVILWLCLSEILASRFSGSGFIRLLSFCSKKITTIYVTQWLVISWGTALAGYHGLDLQGTVIAIFLTTLISLSVPWLLSLRRGRDSPQSTGPGT